MDRLERLYRKALLGAKSMHGRELMEQGEKYMSFWVDFMRYCRDNKIDVPEDQEVLKGMYKDILPVCGYSEDNIVSFLDWFFDDDNDNENNEGEDNDDGNIESLSVDELKTLKANANTRLCRAKNMLKYSSVSKPKDGVENPLPVNSPKRIKYQKKVDAELKLIEKIDYRIAELG